MSGKLKTLWWQVKDGITLCIALIPFVLLGIALLAIMLLIMALIQGTIASICWNIAMPAMFGFQKITLFQACVLAFAISYLRFDYKNEARSKFAELKRENFNKSQNERLSIIVSIILVIVFELISVLITIGITMYSWNVILPQLLQVDLVHINFGQAFGFAYLFHLLFGVSNNVKSKKE